MRIGLLRGFIGCVESLVIVGRSVGIQLTWWTTHQTCRLAYIGIKKDPDNKGTCNDHGNHLTLDLETIIALASMTCIANLGTYECH